MARLRAGRESVRVDLLHVDLAHGLGDLLLLVLAADEEEGKGGEQTETGNDADDNAGNLTAGEAGRAPVLGGGEVLDGVGRLAVLVGRRDADRAVLLDLGVGDGRVEAGDLLVKGGKLDKLDVGAGVVRRAVRLVLLKVGDVEDAVRGVAAGRDAGGVVRHRDARVAEVQGADLVGAVERLKVGSRRGVYRRLASVVSSLERARRAGLTVAVRNTNVDSTGVVLGDEGEPAVGYVVAVSLCCARGNMMTESSSSRSHA